MLNFNKASFVAVPARLNADFFNEICQFLTFPSDGILRGCCSGLTGRLLPCPIVPLYVRQRRSHE